MPLKKVLSNAGWLTSGKLLGDAFALLLFILLSRRFGPEGIGQYAFGLAVAGVGYVLVSLGFQEYAVRECARSSRKQNSILIGELIRIQKIGIFCFSVFLGLFLWFADISFEKAVIIVALSCEQIAIAVSQTLLAPSYSKEDMVAPAVAQFLYRFSAVVFAFCLVLIFDTPLYLAILPFPISALGFLVFGTYSARRYIGVLRISAKTTPILQRIISAWPFSVTVLLFYLRAKGMILLIAFMLGDAQTGIFATAQRFLEVSVMPIVYLAVATYPRLSASFHESPIAFKAAANSLLKLSLIAGGLAVWFMIFPLPFLLIPYLGEKFSESAEIIPYMAVLALLTPVGYTLTRVMLATDLQFERLKISAFSIILNFSLAIALIPSMGLMGLITAWIISVLANIAMSSIAVQKREYALDIHLSFLKFIAVMLPAAVASYVLSAMLVPWWITASVVLTTLLTTILLTDFADSRRYLIQLTCGSR